MINRKNGLEFEFIEGTGSSDINLVFVHGSGCNRKFLRPIQEFISEYNCYFFDLPGHGNSDNTGYSVENYIKAIESFVNDLSNVILLGHSLGGTLVLGAAALNIPSVIGEVVISSGASFPKLDKELMEKIHNGIIDMDILTKLLGHGEDPEVQKAFKLFGPEEVIITDFIIDEEVNIKDCLSDISIPTLIVTGGDEILTLVEYSELIQKQVKNSKLVIIPNTKHMLPIIRRKELGDLIRNFVKEIKK